MMSVFSFSLQHFKTFYPSILRKVGYKVYFSCVFQFLSICFFLSPIFFPTYLLWELFLSYHGPSNSDILFSLGFWTQIHSQIPSHRITEELSFSAGSSANADGLAALNLYNLGTPCLCCSSAFDQFDQLVFYFLPPSTKILG